MGTALSIVVYWYQMLSDGCQWPRHVSVWDVKSLEAHAGVCQDSVGRDFLDTAQQVRAQEVDDGSEWQHGMQ